MATAAEAKESGGLDAVRRGLFVLVWIGVVGLSAELIFLDHTEGFWQKVPLALLSAVAATALLHGVRPNRATTLAFRGALALVVVGGVVGLAQHYLGNREFELEMVPEMGGGELLWETLTGATPVLAPGALVQLGLVGWIYTLRHPALTPRD